MLHLMKQIFVGFLGTVPIMIIFSGTAKYTKVPVLPQMDSATGTASTMRTANNDTDLGTVIPPNASLL